MLKRQQGLKRSFHPLDHLPQSKSLVSLPRLMARSFSPLFSELQAAEQYWSKVQGASLFRPLSSPLCQIFLLIPGDAFSSTLLSLCTSQDCITGLSFLWFPFHFFPSSLGEEIAWDRRVRLGDLFFSHLLDRLQVRFIPPLKPTALWSALSSCGSRQASGTAPFPFPFSLRILGPLRPARAGTSVHLYPYHILL